MRVRSSINNNYDATDLSKRILRDYQWDVYRRMMECSIVNGKVEYRYKNLLLIWARRLGKSTLMFHLQHGMLCRERALAINGLISGIGRMRSCIFAPFENQVREIYIENVMNNGFKLIDIASGISKFSSNPLELNYHFNTKEVISGIKFEGLVKDNKAGAGFKNIVLDEFALIKDNGMEKYGNLLPMVKEKNGGMFICSTVRGRNHMYELYNMITNNPDKYPDWLVMKQDVFDLGIMTQDEYDAIPMDENLKRQEFLCDWDSADEGAIYPSPILADIGYRSDKKLYIGLDLGMTDATVVWYGHLIDDKIYFIASNSYRNCSISVIINEIKSMLSNLNTNNYVVYLPHDAMQLEQTSGNSRFNIMNRELNCRIVRRSSDLLEDIDYIRRMWHSIRFNSKGCSREIEEIKRYVTDTKYNRIRHEHSHAPDGMRTLIMGLKEWEFNNIRHMVINYEKSYNFKNKF